MSKKHKKSQTPSPSELLGKNTPEADEPDAEDLEPVVAVEEPKEATTLEQMVAQLPESIRAKALEELRKLQVQALRNEAAKAWVGFDTALRGENGLPKFIGDLAKQHGVAELLAGRVIKITYPDGKFSYTNSPKGKGNGRYYSFSNGGRNGSNFKSQGKVIAIMLDGRREEHSSLHAFAKFHHIKYEGRPTARVAVEDPWKIDKEGDSYPKHPYKHTIEDKDGTLLVTRVIR